MQVMRKWFYWHNSPCHCWWTIHDIALDMSFSKSIVVEGSNQSSTMHQDYADSCCYTILDTLCRLYSRASVNMHGVTKLCTKIVNKLAIFEEAGSETCFTTQNNFSKSCCYEKCPICPEGSNLNWEVGVEYNWQWLHVVNLMSLFEVMQWRRVTKSCTEEETEEKKLEQKEVKKDLNFKHTYIKSIN